MDECTGGRIRRESSRQRSAFSSTLEVVSCSHAVIHHCKRRCVHNGKNQSWSLACTATPSHVQPNFHGRRCVNEGVGIGCEIDNIKQVISGRVHCRNNDWGGDMILQGLSFKCVCHLRSVREQAENCKKKTPLID